MFILRTRRHFHSRFFTLSFPSLFCDRVTFHGVCFVTLNLSKELIVLSAPATFLKSFLYPEICLCSLDDFPSYGQELVIARLQDPSCLSFALWMDDKTASFVVSCMALELCLPSFVWRQSCRAVCGSWSRLRCNVFFQTTRRSF